MVSPPGEPFDRLHPVLQHHIVNSLGWSALRSLQREAVGPLLAGEDAVLLAPTAGGKTEAAMFPLLTRMEGEQWPGLSVLYVCPLKALLNNLHPRVQRYAGWLGRSAEVRHGDVGAGARRRQAVERPSVLLTTPESLEAMLVSRTIDAARMFADLHAVVIDEVHAFAGDDRGWHLLAVLERLSALAGRPLQRVGLSATVGNPGELLHWLQGLAAGERAASVVAPESTGQGLVADLALDYVGSEANAALVLSRLYAGEKRLVFADSRRFVEGVSVRLREHGVETYISHSSLALDERRRAEAAFAEARDCVIVSTSTLELGIDVGDLDRVRDRYARYTDPGSTVVAADDNARTRWWTFAGARANAVLSAALTVVAPELLETGGLSNFTIALRGDATPQAVGAALRDARRRLGEGLNAAVPDVSERALKRLKFSELLPPHLARVTLAERAADHAHAAWTARCPVAGPVDGGKRETPNT